MRKNRFNFFSGVIENKKTTTHVVGGVIFQGGQSKIVEFETMDQLLSALASERAGMVAFHEPVPAELISDFQLLSHKYDADKKKLLASVHDGQFYIQNVLVEKKGVDLSFDNPTFNTTYYITVNKTGFLTLSIYPASDQDTVNLWSISIGLTEDDLLVRDYRQTVTPTTKNVISDTTISADTAWSSRKVDQEITNRAGSGGGAGAVIDDTSTASNKAWSSSKTSTEIAKKANKDSPVFTTAATLPAATTIGSVTAAELAYSAGLRAKIQDQIDGLPPAYAFKGEFATYEAMTAVLITPVSGSWVIITVDETRSNSLTHYYYDGSSWVFAGGYTRINDATTSVKGVVRLAGDLTGTSDNPQLANTTVTPAPYKVATVTFDAKGRATAAVEALDDTSISENKVWSSQKIADSLSGKADSNKVGSKTINEVAIADRKVLAYNAATNRLEYVTSSAGAPINDGSTTSTTETWSVSKINSALADKADTTAAGNVGSKTVDEAAITDGKVLAYNATSGKLEYVTPSGGVAINDGSTISTTETWSISRTVNALNAKANKNIVGYKVIDEAAIASGKVLAYNSVTDKLEYVTPSGGSAVSVPIPGSGDITVDGTSYSVYSHPIGDGSRHVPATGTTNDTKVLKSGATAGSAAWGQVLFSELANKPTTVAGYGITDAMATTVNQIMAAQLVAQNNTAYGTGQMRNIYLSPSLPSGGGNGDVWIQYA